MPGFKTDQSLVGVWRKATGSKDADDCVEVAPLTAGGAAVRDSKDPGGPHLTLTPSGWAAFTDGIRGGDFD